MAAVVGVALVAAAGQPVIGAPTGVEVRLFQFKPPRLEVRAGHAVTWSNQDDIRHTVTSGSPDRRDGAFEAALDGRGATTRITFARPGIFPYFCDRHQSMRGEIHVQ
jgi:plastocyanin